MNRVYWSDPVRVVAFLVPLAFAAVMLVAFYNVSVQREKDRQEAVRRWAGLDSARISIQATWRIQHAGADVRQPGIDIPLLIPREATNGSSQSEKRPGS